MITTFLLLQIPTINFTDALAAVLRRTVRRRISAVVDLRPADGVGAGDDVVSTCKG